LPVRATRAGDSKYAFLINIGNPIAMGKSRPPAKHSAPECVAMLGRHALFSLEITLKAVWSVSAVVFKWR